MAGLNIHYMKMKIDDMERQCKINEVRHQARMKILDNTSSAICFLAQENLRNISQLILGYRP